MEYQDTPADPVDYLPHPVQPYCVGCDRTPEEIGDYTVMAAMDNMTPSEWVRREEGTLNPANGHFLCDTCYIKAGQPAGVDGRGGPGRWVAP